MDFGIDKCRTVSVKKGKLERHSFQKSQEEITEATDQGNTYRYLGLLQFK